MANTHCDFCRSPLHTSSVGTGGLQAVTYLPCFHAMCSNCKVTRLRGNDRITCAICNLQCSAIELFDHYETDITKLLCLSCNIEKRMPVKWCCESCSRRFLCADCAQPHIQSQHIVHPAKNEIPTRSSCFNHRLTMATHYCSCQLKMCQECVVMHKSLTMTENHQCIPYFDLAEQNRKRLVSLRERSHQDIVIIDNLAPIIAKNRKCAIDLSAKARASVADEVVELCNAVIRRGNDIVAHIDMIEEARLRHYGSTENDLKVQYDRLRKVKSFTENSLVMLPQTQDYPGICSANLFAQSAYKNICDKRTPEVQSCIEAAQRNPQILYFSDLHPILNSIRTLGQVNVDGIVKTPTSMTPPNARMFTVTTANQRQQMNSPGQASSSADSAAKRQGQSVSHSNATAIQKHRQVSYVMQAYGTTTAQCSSPGSPTMALPTSPNLQTLFNAQMQRQILPKPSINNSKISSSSLPPSIPINLSNPQSGNKDQQRPSTSVTETITQNIQNGQTPTMTQYISFPSTSSINQVLGGNQSFHKQTFTCPSIRAQSAAADSTVTLPTKDASTNSLKRQTPLPNIPEEPVHKKASESEPYALNVSPSISTTTPVCEARPQNEVVVSEKDSEIAPNETILLDASEMAPNETVLLDAQVNATANKEHDKFGDKPLEEWDDYCYVCGNGCDEKSGELGCCDKCPRVFHNICHVPMIETSMEDTPEDWTCTLCTPCENLSCQSNEFYERQRLLCSKVLLSCLSDNTITESFVNEVPKTVTLYYDIIKNPISFGTISKRITNEYDTVSKFVDDMNLLFMNCSRFNAPDSPVAKAGSKIWRKYKSAIIKFLPAYEDKVWTYDKQLYIPRASDNRVKRSRHGNTRSKSNTPADLTHPNKI